MPWKSLSGAWFLGQRPNSRVRRGGGGRPVTEVEQLRVPPVVLHGEATKRIKVGEWRRLDRGGHEARVICRRRLRKPGRTTEDVPHGQQLSRGRRIERATRVPTVSGAYKTVDAVKPGQGKESQRSATAYSAQCAVSSCRARGPGTWHQGVFSSAVRTRLAFSDHIGYVFACK